MDWRHAAELLAAGQDVYSELKNIAVWVKNSPGMGSLYRSQHELVFVFKSGYGRHAAHIIDFEAEVAIRRLIREMSIANPVCAEKLKLGRSGGEVRQDGL
jgi:hypothetical protein